MATIETILFDLDGTLVDTEPAAAQAVSACFAEWKIKITPEDARYVTGRTWASAFEYLFVKYSVPVPTEIAARAMMESYRQSLEKSLIVVAGSVSAVRSLSKKFKLGLVSGSNRQEILWILKKLGITEHFKTILGAEDYPKSKPAPDGYLKAIQELKATAPTSLVFEDSNPGITSARAAGAWVVAVTGTNHFKHDTSKAHSRIADLTEVTPDWVNQLSKSLN